MDVSIKGQLICILAAFIYGILSSVLFGIFKTVTLLFGGCNYVPEKRIGSVIKGTVLFVLDFVYCVLFTVGFQILIYAFDYGRFRIVYLLASAVGFLSYSKSLGKLYDMISRKLVFTLRRVIYSVFRCVSCPLRFVICLFFKLIKKIFRVIFVQPFRAAVRNRNRNKVHCIIDNELYDMIKF